jgi:NAD(P)-dependent dehydrogenase (short-subunit alcohol dehydrogenase family)
MPARPAPEPSPAVDPFAHFRLNDKVVLITGTSSGLGTRFARVLHAAGATVVMAARRLDRLETLAAELPGSVAVQADVSVPAECVGLVDNVLERFGRVDVLINNAGTQATFRPEDEPYDEWRRVMAINVDGAFLLAQRCAKAWMLPNQNGVIVNVASMLGIVSSGQLPQASYAASKGALVNLTRELACLWARKGIRVNALCPGFFASELTNDLIDDAGGAKWLQSKTPMGRVGAEGELDGALLFLCSDASSYVTGQTLVVDGGWTAA